MSNPRDEMSRFVTSVADIVKEECHMIMLHNDINLSRLMVCNTLKTILMVKLNRGFDKVQTLLLNIFLLNIGLLEGLRTEMSGKLVQKVVSVS